MTVRDWIGSPLEWGDFGSRATAWFNELATQVRTNETAFDDHIADAAWTDGTLTFEREPRSSGTRIGDLYSATREVVQNGIRVTLSSLTSHIEYMDNGATEIGRWQRDDGYFRLARVESVAPTFSSGWANFGTSDEFLLAYFTADGMVHISGRVSKTSTGTAASGTQFATVPAGWRPSRRVSFIGRTNGASVAVNIETDGAIKFFDLASTGIPQGDYIAFSGQYYVGH